MEKKLYQNRQYNNPVHAHERTFSVYRHQKLFNDTAACELLLEEIANAREESFFRLRAYVFMPDHIHMLIWPLQISYDIAKITKNIKGRMAKKI